MKTRPEPGASAARHALSESGRVPGVRTRVGKRAKSAQPPDNSVVTRSAAYIEPHVREAMISDSAYFRSAHRGFEPGREVDDWLAAEAEIDAALARGDLMPLCG